MTTFEFLCNTETSTARIKRIIIETACVNGKIENRATREILCKYISSRHTLPDLRYSASLIDNYHDAQRLIDIACGWYALHVCANYLGWSVAGIYEMRHYFIPNYNL